MSRGMVIFGLGLAGWFTIFGIIAMVAYAWPDIALVLP